MDPGVLVTTAASRVRGLRHLLGSWRHDATRRYKRTWRRIRLERAARFGPLPRPTRWVFLVGCYNSGTTLLHDILATHPLVGSMPDEGQFFTDQLPIPRDLGLRRLWALEPDRFALDEYGGNKVNLERLLRQWGATFNDPTRPVLIEKTPTNAARTRWLQAHFSGAYFIGIVRDGRAVAEGIRRKTGHSLELAARQWVRSNEIMLRDFECLRHKRLISYEHLTANPDIVVTDLLKFLDLPVHGIGFGDRNWKVHEQHSAIVNMNDRSLQALSRQDLEVVEREAGQLLRALGYSEGTDVQSTIQLVARADSSKG
jgi:hypothetical protein